MRLDNGEYSGTFQPTRLSHLILMKSKYYLNDGPYKPKSRMVFSSFKSASLSVSEATGFVRKLILKDLSSEDSPKRSYIHILGIQAINVLYRSTSLLLYKSEISVLCVSAKM